jgi:hypothetical protein
VICVLSKRRLLGVGMAGLLYRLKLDFGGIRRGVPIIAFRPLAHSHGQVQRKSLS